MPFVEELRKGAPINCYCCEFPRIIVAWLAAAVLFRKHVD